MSTIVHPTAVVEPGATLGEGCHVHAGAVIRRHCVLGERVVVHPYAVLGGEPQYLGFDPQVESGVHIGDETVIREHVTVNRAMHAGQATRVGRNCFLMAGSHVGHDCEVADHVVLANAVLLAGHVFVGARTFLGGGAGVHQFCRIGAGAMIAGHATITRDVPPNVMVAERNVVAGLNVVGLRRRGLGRETLAELKRAFRVVYAPGNVREHAAAALAGGRFASAEAREFLEFLTGGRRPVARPRRDAAAEGAPE
jgi:UDP-N-acetylglucosamine acyltransferase